MFLEAAGPKSWSESSDWRYAGRLAGAMRTIVGVIAVLIFLGGLPSTAVELGKQNAVFKGHELDASIDAQTKQATIALDNRPIAIKEDMAEIGKISTYDLGTSFLFFLHVKTVAGCGSFIVVRVPVTTASDKSEVLSDFGACNDRLTMRLETRQGSAAWYAVAFRDDSATAQVALIRDDKLTTHEVKAPPCLFAPVVQPECMEPLVAEVAGSGELGLSTGRGSFANEKIETFLNRATGKATLMLNGRAFRTFDNAKEFYLAWVEGEDQFGLFVFFLDPKTGCSSRPLVFFAARGSEPKVITDYAPCTDRIARVTRKKAGAIEWSGLAFRAGDPSGYIASVTDHKLSTRTTLLPSCMLDSDTSKEQSCALQALGEVPPGAKPPRLDVVPSAPPGPVHRAPRDMLRGI